MKQNAYLMLFYGFFLIAIAIITILIVGWNAKTALISGGSMGLLAMTIAHFINKDSRIAMYAGFVQTFGLSFIFGWRALKSLDATLQLVSANSLEEVHTKAIAFIMINLMMVVSVVFTAIQFSNIIQILTKKN